MATATFTSRRTRPPASLERRQASGLLGEALRYHPDDQDRITRATQDWKTAALADHVRWALDESPGLRPEQAEFIAALLLGDAA